jgi:hypothetical protein
MHPAKTKSNSLSVSSEEVVLRTSRKYLDSTSYERGPEIEADVRQEDDVEDVSQYAPENVDLPDERDLKGDNDTLDEDARDDDGVPTQAKAGALFHHGSRRKPHGWC